MKTNDSIQSNIEIYLLFSQDYFIGYGIDPPECFGTLYILY